MGFCSAACQYDEIDTPRTYSNFLILLQGLFIFVLVDRGMKDADLVVVDVVENLCEASES